MHPDAYCRLHAEIYEQILLSRVRTLINVARCAVVHAQHRQQAIRHTVCAGNVTAGRANAVHIQTNTACKWDNLTLNDCIRSWIQRMVEVEKYKCVTSVLADRVWH